MLPWMSETKESRTVANGNPAERAAGARSAGGRSAGAWSADGWSIRQSSGGSLPVYRLTLCPVGLGPAAASGTTLIGTPGMEACSTLPSPTYMPTWVTGE